MKFIADDGQLKLQPFHYTERPSLVVQLDFTTKDTIFNSTQTPIAFVNLGPSDLWIDAVSLAELK